MFPDDNRYEHDWPSPKLDLYPPPPRARAAPSFCPPGGPWFNLFNLGGKSEAEMKKLKLNEIKNGRLAMLAVFGYGAQVGPDSALK